VKKFVTIMMVFCLSAGIALTGCGTRKAATSKDAIKISQTIEGKDKQEEYLLDQAQAFVDAEDFKGGLNLTRYTLTAVNRDSKGAREMIRKIHNTRNEYIKQERGQKKQETKKGIQK